MIEWMLRTTVPLEVDVPAPGVTNQPGGLPGGEVLPGGGLPPEAGEPMIADILAQTGGSPLWALAALAVATVLLAAAIASRRRRRV